ncbi:MAG: hypothetical protein WCP28_04630 [Actinomycetes bacterium]
MISVINIAQYLDGFVDEATNRSGGYDRLLPVRRVTTHVRHR